MTSEQTSPRPYLYRALHEWLTDNGQTPYIVVDANFEQTTVPVEFVNDGRIVLNISYSATHNLMLGNDAITFQARFGGRPVDISIPAAAVQAIYGRETGEGMVFDDDSSVSAVAVIGDEADSFDSGSENTAVDEADDRPKKPDRSHLRVIK